MKILLDVSPLESPKLTGIGTYIDQLCRELLRVSENDTLTFWGAQIEKDPFPDSPVKRFMGNQAMPRWTLENLWDCGIAFRAKTEKMDVYHLTFPAKPAPRPAHVKYVATIYDLAFAYYPESVTTNQSFRELSYNIPRQAEEADRIITISESTKSDICRILGTPPEKIVVSYPGTDLRPPNLDDPTLEQSADWRSLQLPKNYLLCLGTWEPRKNLPSLFRALSQIRDRLERDDLYLCLSGVKGWKYDEAIQLISELGLEKRILTLGYVPRNLLPLLYARARLFVYPSMYEGFGMPVTEAMICGAPVITSNVSSLPEAGGDAALLIDTSRPELIAEAILHVLDDETLRGEMIRKGLLHATQFTWENAARDHLKVYHELGGSV